jgi:hypothetical protein
MVFSGHAVQRMFQRAIGRDEVHTVISNGETITDYPDDTPYPSRLLLGFVSEASRPIHVVVAWNGEENKCIVVTAYEPAADHWEPGFRKRRTK